MPLVYVHIDQSIYKVKLKVDQNEKRKKLCGFSFSINMANFDGFCWNKKLSSNLFFLKSAFGKKLVKYIQINSNVVCLISNNVRVPCESFLRNP